MRMSSGASVAYEKPRSGRSSCMLETPRSSRTASARTPFSASWVSTIEKSPRRKRALTPGGAPEALEVRAHASGRGRSRSPCRRPSGRARAARRGRRRRRWRRRACARARGASSARTSSARTGTWSVVLGCKTFGNMLCTSHDLLQLGAPGGAIPDLEPSAHADDDHLAAEPGVLDQGGRHHHAALLVGLRLDRARVVEALQDACLAAERVEAGESRLDQLRPVRRPDRPRRRRRDRG